LALPNLPTQGKVLAIMGALEKKIAGLVRRLATPFDGEKLATLNAIERVLASHGTDFNGLANGVEKFGDAAVNGGSLNQAEAERIWDAAYVRGCEDTERKAFGLDDFRSADGKPPWDAVALYVQQNKQRLAAKHHEFIDDMAARSVWGREPTRKQHKYLFSLFHQIGGRMTP
jgi:hypothetical protein